jgi:uncharacterized damage-inducible protein DinB
MAGRVSPSDGIATLLALLDEAFDCRSWHGTNLKGSIRGMSAERAARRPAAGRHSVVEIIAHCAYWKYSVRRRLLNQSKGSFPLKGSDWFSIAEPLDEKTWRGYVRILTEEHRQLRQAVADFDVRRLSAMPAGSTTSYAKLIRGAVFHDIYHAGQIQFIKRVHE